jgi:hypothetical protein
MTQFGQRGSVAFEIDFGRRVVGHVDVTTEGHLAVWLNGQVVWGRCGGAEESTPLCWHWVELLEFLALNWVAISVEEAYPADLSPQLPGLLWAAAEERWRRPGLSQDQLEDESVRVHAYARRHDLATALAGLFPPSLFVVPEGDCILFSTDEQAVPLLREDALGMLAALGDEIAARVKLSRDERGQQALAWWHARDRGAGPDRLLRLATGLRRDQLVRADVSEYLQAVDWEHPWEDGLLLAARSVGRRLQPRELRALLAFVCSLPRLDHTRLDNVTRQLHGVGSTLLGPQASPSQEGYDLARTLRRLLGVGPEERVEPEANLRHWGVHVDDVAIPDDAVQALAVWGAGPGPAVLLNLQGTHASDPHGRRATIAHEVCHLLVDRCGHRPAGDVRLDAGTESGQPAAEKRANAFAAEWLLPGEKVLRNVAKGDNCTRALREVARAYDVSGELAAWQFYNHYKAQYGTPPPAEFAPLREFVRDKHSFDLGRTTVSQPGPTRGRQ